MNAPAPAPTYPPVTQLQIDQRVFDLYDEYCHGRIDNNSTPRYNEAAAKLSWDRTIAHFKKHLA